MFFVLVAVLVLRGWVGEAMAGQMLAMELATAQASAQMAAMPDCPGHAAMDAAADDAGQGMNCGSCLSCQACSLNALPTAAVAAAPSMIHAHPPSERVLFASAPAAPGFKPPIS
jgi:hypothetical protein